MSLVKADYAIASGLSQRPRTTTGKRREITPEKEKKYTGIIALLNALCLEVIFVSFFLFDNKVVQESSFLLLTVPMLLQVWVGMVDFRNARRTFSVALFFLLSITLSFLLHVTEVADVQYELLLIGNTFYSFLLATVLMSWKNGAILGATMRALLPLIAPVLIFVLYHERNAYFEGRWEPYFTGDTTGAHPNAWGLLALGCGWCALAWRNTAIRFLGLALAFYYMFLVQSRGAMVALFVAFVFCTDYFFPLRLKKVIVLSAMAFLGSAFLIFSEDQRIVKFIENDVLLFNDPQRGLGTGMTGRTYAYEVAWKSVGENPFFGAGLGKFGFVHNGFLIILSESGIFGLTGVILILLISIWRYVRVKDWAGVGYVLSYVTMLMTYPRTFNVNVTSLLAIMVLMKGLSNLSVKPENRPVGKPLIRPLRPLPISNAGESLS